MQLKKRSFHTRPAKLSALFLALWLCGCAAGQAGTGSSTPQESAALPAASTAGPTAAPPESPLPEETPLPQPAAVSTPNPDGEWYSPDFLTGEQRAVYDQAMETIGYMLGGAGNLAYGYGNKPGEELRLENGWPYILIARGPDRDYEAFRTRMLAIYTEDCLADLDFDRKFVSCDGQLAANDGGIGSNSSYTWDGCPDLYRPEEQSEETVRFIIIGHYIEGREGETDEEFLARRDAGGFDRTEEFPIRLVHTPDGWRVDEFHCPYYY